LAFRFNILRGGFMNINYILKVQDAKAVDIQKALQAVGIKATSIIEVYKDKIEEAKETKPLEK
jgi:hypothetical protein